MLKKISYLHAERLSAGEMKHGPIALIEPNVISMVLLGRGITGVKTLANIEEIKARKGKILAISHPENLDTIPPVEKLFLIPKTFEFLTPLLLIIPL